MKGKYKLIGLESPPGPSLDQSNICSMQQEWPSLIPTSHHGSLHMKWCLVNVRVFKLCNCDLKVWSKFPGQSLFIFENEQMDSLPFHRSWNGPDIDSNFILLFLQGVNKNLLRWIFRYIFCCRLLFATSYTTYSKQTWFQLSRTAFEMFATVVPYELKQKLTKTNI